MRPRIVAAVAWLALVAGLALDLLDMVGDPADCASRRPAAVAGDGVGTAPGEVRWSMLLECGGEPGYPWASADNVLLPLSDLTLAGDVLAVRTPGSDVVNGYDLRTGRRRWSRELGRGARVQLSSGSGGSILVGARGETILLDARTGSIRWRRALEGRVELAGDHVLLREDSTLTGLDPHTGQDRWRTPVRRGNPPPTDGTYVYFDASPAGSPMTQQSVGRIDLRTGQASYLFLSAPVTGELEHAAPGTLLFLDNGATTAVDSATGEVRWTRPGRPGRRTTAAIVLADGRSTDVVDMQTGRVRWRVPHGAGFLLGLGDGYVLRGESDNDGDGLLVAVNADGSPRWRADPLAQPWEVAVTRDTLLVVTCVQRYNRCDRRRLVAIALG